MKCSCLYDQQLFFLIEHSFQNIIISEVSFTYFEIPVPAVSIKAGLLTHQSEKSKIPAKRVSLLPNTLQRGNAFQSVFTFMKAAMRAAGNISALIPPISRLSSPSSS